jgi:RNA polymerase sigma-70 factor, ECF subfamily
MVATYPNAVETRPCVVELSPPHNYMSLDQPAGEVTLLLHAWSQGDRSVEQRLFELVLPDLHRLAEYFMRQERPDHSLQPTALLNEAYCRLVRSRERDWQNRQHFFAVAARVMRRFLINHARSRPKGQKILMEDAEPWLPHRDDKIEQAIAVDVLLNEIEATQPDWCSVVEMKFFLGFTDEETSEALGMPLRTMQRKFGDARRWLYERLESK